MKADELAKLVEQKNALLLRLEEEKRGAQQPVIQTANQVADLEGKIADCHLRHGHNDKAVVHLISQASCLVDAGATDDAVEVFGQARRLATSDKLRSWIEREVKRLSHSESLIESLSKRIQEMEEKASFLTNLVTELRQALEASSRRGVVHYASGHGEKIGERDTSALTQVPGTTQASVKAEAAMVEILEQLHIAGIIISRELTILHANNTARRYFCRVERRSGKMEFSDLPQLLGAKVYQALKSGSAISSFKYEPENSPGKVYNVNVVPIQVQQAGLPAPALLMAGDLAQSEQQQRLEIEAASLRLVRTMADRLTHEICNAMVPLSTHQQMLADNWKDPKFRASLNVALADGVRHVTRLINQMRFLSLDSLGSQDAFPLAPLIEEAYQEACKYQPAKAAPLNYDMGSTPIVLSGDRAALKHALAEVMLNALQANPADPKVGVRSLAESSGDQQGLQIEVQDNGAGFTPEAAQKPLAPFFTTRNVGLGMGLTVSRKIIETHRGKLEILAPKSGQSGVVRISLPLDRPFP